MRAKTTALLVALLAGIGIANPVYLPETPRSLSLPPEAASVALAGALAGTGPGIANAFFNPAVLAGLPRAEVAASWGPWDNEYWPNASHAWAGFGIPVADRLTLGIDASLTPRGEAEVIDEHGNIVTWLLVFDATLGAKAALALDEHWSAGLGLKLFFATSPEDAFGIEPFPFQQPEAVALAPLADAGVRWRPSRRVGLGLSLCNAGPHIQYDKPGPMSPGPTAIAPWTARLGGDCRMLELGPVNLDLLAQVSASLARRAGTARPSFIRSFSRCVALDGLVWNIVSLRLGYLDDPIADRHGVTAGIGLRLRDIARIDIGTDALTYPYSSHGWRLSVASSNLPAIWRHR